MVSVNIDHHKIVRDAISGERQIDQQVIASMSILEERLEKLRKLGPQFAGIGFSPAASNIITRTAVVA